jgi:diacylglycerol kinase (ATP)
MAASPALTVRRAAPGDVTTRGPILVIWNPAAGTKAGVRTNTASEADLRQALAAHGFEADFFESHSPTAAMARIDEAVAAGAEVIVAAGGDGTARSVATRLLDTKTALGILPTGSAMNLARSLDISTELEPAAAIIAAGNVRTIDVGEVRGRPFIEQVNVGLSAEAFAKAQAIDKRRYGAALGLLGLLLRGGRTRIELDIDGTVQQSRALALSIANTPYTGLGIDLAPDAHIDDGLLDVVVFEGLSPFGLARYLAATIGGRDDPPERFRTYRGRRVRIETHRPLPVRFDAEDAGSTPVEIGVRPGSLRVVAPPKRS